MNIQFRDRPEPSASVSVKTAIADCDIHPARATAEELYPFWKSAGMNISRPTASRPITA